MEVKHYMADENNQEVKEFVQTVRVGSAPETEENEEENETPAESSEEETNDVQEEPEEPIETESEEEPEQAAETPKEPKPVDGETPREKALRLETTRLKGLLRKERQDELFVAPQTAPIAQEDDVDLDPEQVKTFDKLARKLGFVKQSDQVAERNDDVFQIFLEEHSEYDPANDKDSTLWNQFKQEFKLYAPPQDPKTLKKVLNKVHNEIFGVQPAANLTKINAQREKIKVASHTGASVQKVAPRARVQAPSGLRMDAMKGFSDAELKELGF